MTAERLFVAVVPPPEVIDVISDLPTEPQRGVRFTSRANWHITLRFLGECERSEALAALESLQAKSATATLGPEVTLLGSRIVMLPIAGLDGLADATTAAFEGVGDPDKTHSFSGHLTLARLKGAPLKNPASVSVLGAPVSVTFPVERVALVKSEVDSDAVTYTVIAERVLS